MNRRLVLSLFASASLFLAAGTAFADPPRVLRGQFTDRIERSQPVGDAQAMRGTSRATYFLEVANSGDPVVLTIVWNIDGRQVRQTLDVGRAPRWRTWASARITSSTRSVSVEVLDAAGTRLHQDSVTLSQ